MMRKFSSLPLDALADRLCEPLMTVGASEVKSITTSFVWIRMLPRWPAVDSLRNPSRPSLSIAVATKSAVRSRWVPVIVSVEFCNPKRRMSSWGAPFSASSMRALRSKAVQNSTSRAAPRISAANRSRSTSPVRGEKPATIGASDDSGLLTLIHFFVSPGVAPPKRTSKRSRYCCASSGRSAVWTTFAWR